jgi:hypothetical protein
MLMTAEEALGAGKDVPNDDSGAKRIYDVLVVGVEEEAVVCVAFVRWEVPEKPMTALIWMSCCIDKVIFLNYQYSNVRHEFSKDESQTILQNIKMTSWRS